MTLHRPGTIGKGYQGTGAVADYDPTKDAINIYSTPSEGYTRDSLLHEAQHGIAKREGFAFYSPDVEEIVKASKRRFDAQSDHYNKYNAGVRGPDLDAAEQAAKAAEAEEKSLQSSWDKRPIAQRADIYRRTPGEVEARNVEKRRAMTPDERRATPPWVTQDVPDDQVLVRRK